jgi:hypothetical protein
MVFFGEDKNLLEQVKMYYKQSRGLRDDDVPSNINTVHGDEDEDDEESDKSKGGDSNSNHVDSAGRIDHDNDRIHKEEGSVGNNNKQNEDCNTVSCGGEIRKKAKHQKTTTGR